MNARRLQQVRADVRRTIGRHTLALGLGLSLLIVALATQRYTAPRAKFAPATSASKPTPIASQGWPGATLTGSAYVGQAAHLYRSAIHRSSWPDATLTGSAYNGSAQLTARPIAPSSGRGWPGATLTGSAYDEESIYSSRPAELVVAGWPGATLMGSAYNGQ